MLKQVYKINNEDIVKALYFLFELENVQVENERIVKCALEIFRLQNLDFVDTLLFAYKKMESKEILTFDRKLNNLLKQI